MTKADREAAVPGVLAKPFSHKGLLVWTAVEALSLEIGGNPVCTSTLPEEQTKNIADDN